MKLKTIKTICGFYSPNNYLQIHNDGRIFKRICYRNYNGLPPQASKFHREYKHNLSGSFHPLFISIIPKSYFVFERILD